MEKQESVSKKIAETKARLAALTEQANTASSTLLDSIKSSQELKGFIDTAESLNYRVRVQIGNSVIIIQQANDRNNNAGTGRISKRVEVTDTETGETFTGSRMGAAAHFNYVSPKSLYEKKSKDKSGLRFQIKDV